MLTGAARRVGVALRSARCLLLSGGPQEDPAVSMASLQSDGTALTPQETVDRLDQFVVGQEDAKRAVAIALRNRWRRKRVQGACRDEICPKNILISRRLAKLTDAPFVKVEATKFTEVGFHGRDVETIMDDLFHASLAHTRDKLWRLHRDECHKVALDRVLAALVGDAPDVCSLGCRVVGKNHFWQVQKSFRELLEKGELDSQPVEVDIPVSNRQGSGDMPGVVHDIWQMLQRSERRTARKRMPVSDAIHAMEQVEMERIMETQNIHLLARDLAEQDGIVVIDEIDKIVTSHLQQLHHQVSSEGVQQDLLPLVEGTTVTLKNGMTMRTDHVLFIAGGAFHTVKPSDMIAELQGRFPIRVELRPLSEDDFYRILTEPQNNLVSLHVELLKTEGVVLEFTDEAVRKIAAMATQANAALHNIGARRLITILEKVLEEVSYDAPALSQQTVVIGPNDVEKSVGALLRGRDPKQHML